MPKTLLPPSSKSSIAINRRLSKTLARYPEAKRARRQRRTKVGLVGLLLASALTAGVLFGISAAKAPRGDL